MCRGRYHRHVADLSLLLPQAAQAARRVRALARNVERNDSRMEED
jgi:hypothetical protein